MQVDEALNEQALAAEGWATKTRSLFAVVFAASAIWTWNNPSNAKYVYLQLTAAWMVMAAAGAVKKIAGRQSYDDDDDRSDDCSSGAGRLRLARTLSGARLGDLPLLLPYSGDSR